MKLLVNIFLLMMVCITLSHSAAINAPTEPKKIDAKPEPDTTKTKRGALLSYGPSAALVSHGPIISHAPLAYAQSAPLVAHAAVAHPVATSYSTVNIQSSIPAPARLVAYHAPAPVAYHAPVASLAAYHAPLAAYHAPLAAYHAPVAYHAPIAYRSSLIAAPAIHAGIGYTLHH